MEYAVSVLLSGISVGGQYALIAIGYTMVYGILRLINFAHGDVFMVAGLVMVYVSASLPLYIAIPIVLVATVVLGFLIERVAYKPLRSAPRMSVMISAIGVSYLLQNFAIFVNLGETDSPLPEALEMILLFESEMEKHADLIRPVRSYADIEQNQADGVMSALLTGEEGEITMGNPDFLYFLYIHFHQLHHINYLLLQ